MSFFKQAILLITVFCSGVLFANLFLSNTPQPTANIQTKTQEAKKSASNSVPFLDFADKLQSQDVSNIDVAPSSNKSKSLSIQDLDRQKVSQLINALPDDKLDAYLQSVIRADRLDLIDDKRKFAQNAIDALLTENGNEQLSGQIWISDSEITPNQNMDTYSLAKKQKLFAHFDTFGRTQHNGTVFIKWVHRDSGKVILFTMKRITANSNTNWVSVLPDYQWEPGAYDVKYYKFTSELEPIAQTTYQVYEIQ